MEDGGRKRPGGPGRGRRYRRVGLPRRVTPLGAHLTPVVRRQQLVERESAPVEVSVLRGTRPWRPGHHAPSTTARQSGHLLFSRRTLNSRGSRGRNNEGLHSPPDTTTGDRSCTDVVRVVPDVWGSAAHPTPRCIHLIHSSHPVWGPGGILSRGPPKVEPPVLRGHHPRRHTQTCVVVLPLNRSSRVRPPNDPTVSTGGSRSDLAGVPRVVTVRPGRSSAGVTVRPGPELRESSDTSKKKDYGITFVYVLLHPPGHSVRDSGRPSAGVGTDRLSRPEQRPREDGGGTPQVFLDANGSRGI